VADSSFRTTLRRLCRRPHSTPAEGITDAQLLRRFVAQQDEAAFELLLWRHERLVLGVSRRVLGHAQDAEDVFQATFLAFVRKAASILRQGSVASWLYKVAYRLALHARAAASKRALHEKRCRVLPPAPASADPAAQVLGRDLWTCLDEEVNRLPERYRAAVVLCYLHGKSYEEAARELGWPKGTVSTRLTRAREILRRRLTWRGVSLPAGGLAFVVGHQAAPATAPARLMEAARQTALRGAAHPANVPARVNLLAEAISKAMFWHKVRVIALAGLAAALAVGVVVATGQTLPAVQPVSGPQRAAPRQESPDPARADQAKLQGRWVCRSAQRDGRPATREEAGSYDFAFQDDRLVFGFATPFGVASATATYQLRADRIPRAIDLQFPQGERKGQVVRGIYVLSKDELRLCLNEKGPQRPTTFAAPAESGCALYIFQPGGSGGKE
jgi:RNA polymerase sigma factor (sigma-70 family)